MTVNVTADDGDHTITRSFTIAVEDVNESPTDILLDNLTVSENLASAPVGALSVVDPDDPAEPFGQHTLSVDDARFQIVSGQLSLTATSSLDHETEDTIVINVTADDGDNTFTVQFVLSVVDVNETPTDITLDDLDVVESSDGAVVGTIDVIDPDDPTESFGQHTFVVSDARFEVSGGVLKLLDSEQLDHETESSITLDVTADDGDHSILRSFTLNVVDVNESPTNIALDNTVISENADGAVVGQVTFDDPDDPNESFGQPVLSVDDARFEIVSGQLQLRSGQSIDHEAESTVSVTITADDGLNTPSAVFVLSITDVNESPTSIALDNQTVDENDDGAVIATITVSDPDDASEAFGQHTLSVNDTRFEIVGGQLRLQSGQSLDHEVEPSVTVEITADDGLNSLTQSFVITVSDVNEAPTAIDLSNLDFDENDSGAVVGDLTVTDVDDPSESFGQHALSVDDARFEIVGGQLRLQAGNSLDHEVEDVVVVQVTADDGDHTFTQQFTLTVNDLNEVPTSILLDNSDVVENASGATIGVLTVVDEDSSLEPFGQHTLSVDDSRFQIVGNELQLQSGVSLDHESEATVAIQITADDGTTFVQDLTITVVDENESPTDISISNTSVEENASGAVIGDVTVTDPDDPSESFGQHTLTVDDTRFEIVSGSLRLVAGQSLNHESEPSIDVTITADDGDNTYSELFTIEVVDVNEAPTNIALDNSSVDENASAAAIGILTVTDPDDPSEAFGTHSLTVDDARFEVVSSELRLRSGESLDHETESSVTLAITADDGDNTFTLSFSIDVVDINESPTDIQLDNSNADEETAGAVFGGVTVTDEDDAGESFGQHTLTVNDSRFEIVAGQLQLVSGQSLDHETEPTVTLEITATDGGGLAHTREFTLTVDDINETPTSIAASNLSVDENSSGATIGVLSVTDPDDSSESFGQHTFAVSDARFDATGGQLQLASGVSLDHETESTVSLDVTATDGGGLSITRTFVITVVDVNESPTAIDIDNTSVIENSRGASIGVLTVTDPDDSASDFGTHVLVVDDSRFEVDGDVLQLRSDQDLDHELEPTVTVTVTATDTPGLSFSQSFVITVGDLNEAPTDVLLDNLTVVENQSGAVVGNVSAVDEDDASEPFGQHNFTVDDARFEIASGQLQLVSGQSLNFETEPTVIVNLTATDLAGESVTRTYTLEVIDDNDAPEDLTLSNTSVDENDSGATIGVVTVTDEDDTSLATGQHTLQVDDSRFEFSGNELKLADGQSLDHEAESSVTLLITATDGGGLDYSAQFVIDVVDINEFPSDIALDNSLVDENDAGAVIGTVTITDVDDPNESFGQHTVTSSDDRFEVVSGSLQLKSGVSLDHESEPSITLQLSATDGGGLVLTESFVITVVDINESPLDIALSDTTIAEDTDGAVVGTVTVDDPDDASESFGQHTFTVSDGRFEVSSASGDPVLQLQSGETVDFELESEIVVTVRATDGAGAFVELDFTITVIDAAETMYVTAPGGDVTLLRGVDSTTGRDLLRAVDASGTDVAPAHQFENVTDVVVTGSSADDRLIFDATAVQSGQPAGGFSFDGGDGSDTIVGPDLTNAWELSGTDAGQLNGYASFSNVENVTGGDGRRHVRAAKRGADRNADRLRRRGGQANHGRIRTELGPDWNREYFRGGGNAASLGNRGGRRLGCFDLGGVARRRAAGAERLTAVERRRGLRVRRRRFPRDRRGSAGRFDVVHRAHARAGRPAEPRRERRVRPD